MRRLIVGVTLAAVAIAAFSYVSLTPTNADVLRVQHPTVVSTVDAPAVNQPTVLTFQAPKFTGTELPHYNAFRAMSCQGPWKLLNVKPFTSRLEDTDVEPGTYCYRVTVASGQPIGAPRMLSVPASPGGGRVTLLIL